MKQFISALLLTLIFIPISAQLNLPIRKIGDKEYYYRQVKKKETIYGISKQLGIPKEDIIKYNPSVASGLKKDQWLYFPVDEFNDKNSKHRNTARQHIHIVKNGETLYGLSRTYNISISELKNSNPTLKDGLKSGSKIIIPISNVINDQQAEPIPYVIKQGETLYRVALNNNTTIEAILEANPGISPTNFKAGETILIPINFSDNKQTKKPDTVFIAEKVNKGDSYESVAEKYDVSADDLKEANPQTDKLKKGSYIYVPITQEPDTLTNNEILETYNTIHKIDTSDTISIALILPFVNGDGQMSQKGRLYKDFYGGFLMALNQFSNKDFNINLSAYDSADKTVTSILSDPSLKKTDLIFIAGNDNEISKVGEFGEKYGINIVNAFSINDDKFYDNERMFQINTPSSYMYAALQNVVNEKFNDYRIVFISDNDDDNDKPLVEHLKNTNLPRQTITINELSDLETFKTLIPDTHKILFVPTQSNKHFLKALKAALSSLKKDSPKYQFSLLGYPEWDNYNEYKPFFYDSDTYIYSRYSHIGNEHFISDLNDKYEYWYGHKPMKSIPSMSILGYDLAMFFIPAIQNNNNDFNHGDNSKEGIESCISLKRVSNWGGFVNTSVFLINYKPDKTTKRTIIK